jgi:hypothetical protein
LAPTCPLLYGYSRTTAEGATAFSSGILCPAETQEWPDKETCAG